MIKRIIVSLSLLLFLACNDSVDTASIRDVVSQNTIDNWVTLDTINKDAMVKAWKKRKRISSLGSPSYMFYRDHNQNHKIVKIQYNNGKTLEFEISGTMVRFNGNYYNLDLDTSFQFYLQK